jgi:hypothetical protein
MDFRQVGPEETAVGKLFDQTKLNYVILQPKKMEAIYLASSRLLAHRAKLFIVRA